jgi:hypothetical protein
MAKQDTTMLVPSSAFLPVSFHREVLKAYHVHAFIADTSGFTMVGKVLSWSLGRGGAVGYRKAGTACRLSLWLTRGAVLPGNRRCIESRREGVTAERSGNDVVVLEVVVLGCGASHGCGSAS